MTANIASAISAATPNRRKAAPWFIAQGVLFIILGVLAAALPGIAGLAAALVFGWALVVCGVMGLIGLFGSRAHAHPVWSLISALVALAAGVLVLWRPIAGAAVLALFVAAYFAVHGVASIGLGLDQRKRAARRWGWLVASGVVDLVLAAIIIVLGPLARLVLVGFLVGLDLIVSGVALVMLGLAARRAAA
jgi:uncharacterized membrane protein HdeD (DUF308 family)